MFLVKDKHFKQFKGTANPFLNLRPVFSVFILNVHYSMDGYLLVFIKLIETLYTDMNLCPSVGFLISAFADRVPYTDF